MLPCLFTYFALVIKIKLHVFVWNRIEVQKDLNIIQQVLNYMQLFLSLLPTFERFQFGLQVFDISVLGICKVHLQN